MTDKPDTSRAAFEAVFNRRGYSIERNHCRYLDNFTEFTHSGWQAGRADFIAKLDSEEMVEAVAITMAIRKNPGCFMAKQERKLGYAICKTEAGSKNRDGRPVFLDELLPNQGRKYKDEPPIKCGIICEGATA